MNNKLVSVIIPFYKNKKWLIETIESVISQTYPNVEIILVNDGSEEDILDILVKYRDKLKYIYQENMGAGIARNSGIKIAKGYYITFIDSDDMWDKSHLGSMVRFMDENDFLWAHSYYTTFLDSDYSNTNFKNKEFEGSVAVEILFSCPIAMLTVVINRLVFDDNPHFRFSDWKYGQDFYLWSRIATKYKLGQNKVGHSYVRLRGLNASSKCFSQLLQRSKTLSVIVEHKPFFKNKLIYYNLKWLLLYCKVSLTILNYLFKNEKIKELFAKLVYIYPYFGIKIFRNFYKL